MEKRSFVGDLVPTCPMVKKYFVSGLLVCASLAQSAARQSHNLKVVSSSLTGGTFFSFSHSFSVSSSLRHYGATNHQSVLLNFFMVAYEQSLVLEKRRDSASGESGASSGILTAQAMVAYSRGDQDTCKQLLFQA